MFKRLKFWLNRLREKLWIRPLIMCVLSLFSPMLAKGVEATPLAAYVPSVTVDSVDTLLKTMAGSMLVIATFAVGSMVSSLASAGRNATPRAFAVMVSDDQSQNALSIFIGAYIFSLVSLVFLKNGFYNEVGITVLLGLTGATFVVVILTFIRWVDSIARLGRLGTTVDKVVRVTVKSIEESRRSPTMGCGDSCEFEGSGDEARTASRRAVMAKGVGYVQRVDADTLQQAAERFGVRVVVRALAGTFASPEFVLAEVVSDDQDAADAELEDFVEAFVIGSRRTFDEDPRFGLTVLSEIAGRALSPAVNDPGTAIDILGEFVRLFAVWAAPVEEDEQQACKYDRVWAPRLNAGDLIDDAFTSIARDGAGSVEVVTRLQRALQSLAAMDDPELQDAARRHSRQALERAAHAMSLAEDVERVRELAAFSKQD